MTYQAKAAQYKKDAVQTLSKYMLEYPVVGVVNVENMPARQLQVLRAKLRKDALLTMSKKLFINRAIDSVKGSKKNFEKLSESVTGMPALIFTKQNPFKVAALIMASKSKAPAKPGQVAPHDLIIPAGPTPFTPGPVISELSAAGLKTGVENGKVTIKEAAVIVKQGDVVTNSAADILTKFKIEPMEIGLNLVAAYEDGLIYGKEVLSVSPEQYLEMIHTAASEALGLSIEIAYPTKENIERLIASAYNTTKNLALDLNLPSDVVAEKDIGEASRAAKSIADAANITDKAPKPEVKAEPAEATAEVKKEEPTAPATPEVKKEEPAAPATPEVKKEPVQGVHPQPPQPEVKPESAPVEKPVEPEVKPTPVDKPAEPKPEAAAEEKKEIPVEEKKEIKEAPKEQKQADMSQAEQLSKDFKEEIASEKERRDNMDQAETEKLVKQLKKKGTLRQ